MQGAGDPDVIGVDGSARSLLGQQGMYHHVARTRQGLLFETHTQARALWLRIAQDVPGLHALCLMPNHVHLILVPASPDGLHKALGEALRRTTRHVNFREGWRGYLWQERFA